MLERTNPTLTLDDSTAADDSDPTETAEWLDALEFGLSRRGRRARRIHSVRA